MGKEMEKQYRPGVTEARWRAAWHESGLFGASGNGSAPPFTIVIPPPNVTGVLHIGHALNNTLQDVLVRWKRMSGHDALWVPGTDHAGIATQNVVERFLLEKGLTREALGREQFIRHVWEWKEERGGRIIEQLKHLGASCDWSRERFTMDEGLSRAVHEAFLRLYRKGLVYRGDYIVNWCPRCTTALSSEEAAHRAESGKLYHIRYPGVDGGPGVTVATTRPETIFGDVAVAVNPRDARYRALVGKRVRLPVLGRPVPVVAHRSVERGFGTGAVKITPHHDLNDFRVARDLGLEGITIMDDRGVLNREAGPFAGLERQDARRELVARLSREGFLDRVEDHPLSVGRCYRCDSVVEPRLSRQWFVRMKPLAEPALEWAARGKPVFRPARWGKVYRQWLENIEDWCISRQIWWGHRLPVYYCCDCPDSGETPLVPAGPDAVPACSACRGRRVEQDPDVLDTWFSSWLWPFSVFGWPEKTPALKVFYPTDTLVTAPEIIFFWVSRMIMAGLEFTGRLPFESVHIHGTVRDETGRKMSKSFGNVVDPMEIISEVGADALRFSLVSFAGQGQDLFIGKRSFETGRNFANKVWNAARFVLASADEQGLALEPLPPGRDLTFAQRWILSESEELRRRVNRALALQRFNEASGHLYRFFWHVYCDWYLEMAKVDLEEGDGRPMLVAAVVLDRFLRLLHPVMPFLTEEVWSRLNAAGLAADPGPFLSRAPWPKALRGRYRPEVNRRAASFIAAVGAARDIRSAFGVPNREKIPAVLVVPDPEDRAFLLGSAGYLRRLAGLASLEVTPARDPGRMEASRIFPGGQVRVGLAGLFDPSVERARLARERDSLSAELGRLEKRLADDRFLERAPPEVVEKERARHRRMTLKRETIEENLRCLE